MDLEGTYRKDSKSFGGSILGPLQFMETTKSTIPLAVVGHCYKLHFPCHSQLCFPFDSPLLEISIPEPKYPEVGAKLAATAATLGTSYPHTWGRRMLSHITRHVQMHITCLSQAQAGNMVQRERDISEGSCRVLLAHG